MTPLKGRHPIKTTNATDRAKMIWMWVSGQSAREIAQDTGASVSTVYRWIRRWEQEGTVANKPRKRKPYICVCLSPPPVAPPEYPFPASSAVAPYFGSRQDSYYYSYGY